jgi:hypothetical protein
MFGGIVCLRGCFVGFGGYLGARVAPGGGFGVGLDLGVVKGDGSSP